MEGFHDTAFASADAMPELGIVEAMDRFALAGKARAVARVEDYTSFVNSLPICSFMSLTVAGIHNTGELTGMLAAATGWKDIGLEEELAIGERNYVLARAFTMRESGGQAVDRLPFKITQPMPEGATKGQRISADELKSALAEYYQIRGWSEDGRPTAKKLRELGLDAVSGSLR